MIYEDLKKTVNGLIVRCYESDDLARNILEDFLRNNNFGSSLRREITDYFYCGIRFYGLFKSNMDDFSCKKAYEAIENENINNPPTLSEISGFNADLAETVLQNINDIRPFFYRAPMSIRVNPIKTTRDLLLEELSERYDVFATDVSPVGLKFKEHINVRQFDTYKKGYFEIQDEGSQLIPLLLNIKTGEKVLDYCAGTGGKSLEISALTFDSADIYINDIKPGRLKKAVARGKKAGIKFKQLKNEQYKFFDKVLVDAPCSGLGAMRRDADLPMRLDSAKLENYTALQKKIFSEALPYVKPGGLIAYVTCSFLAQENENQVDYFLNKNTNLELVHSHKIIDKHIAKKLNLEKFFRTSPQLYDMDALFGAVFRVL